jgi:hypothetical protein
MAVVVVPNGVALQGWRWGTGFFVSHRGEARTQQWISQTHVVQSTSKTSMLDVYTAVMRARNLQQQQ